MLRVLAATAGDGLGDGDATGEGTLRLDGEEPTTVIDVSPNRTGMRAVRPGMGTGSVE